MGQRGLDGRTASRGFSLIEILVALAVLVPVVIVTVGVLPFFRLSSTRAWTSVSASDMAREQLEKVRGTAFDSVASASGQEDRNGTRFSWVLNVTPLEADSTWRKRVVVSVSWQNPEPQKLSFETVVVRSGLPPSPSPSGTASTSAGKAGNGKSRGAP